MKTLMSIFKKQVSSEAELRAYAEEIKKNDELKAEAFKNKSKYISCHEIRLGSIARPEGFNPYAYC